MCLVWKTTHYIYNKSICLDSPVCPEEMDWSKLYPEFCRAPDERHEDEPDRRKGKVEFADIGCGYGGLLGNVAHYLCSINKITCSQSAGRILKENPEIVTSTRHH